MWPQLQSAHPRVGDRGKQTSGTRMRATGAGGFAAAPMATVVGAWATTGCATRGSARATPSMPVWWTLGSRRRYGDEGGWRVIRGDVVDVDLFEEEQGASLIEHREGMLHFQVRDHVTKLPVQPVEQRQHKGSIANGIAKLGEGARHHLQVVAEISDG